MTCCDDHRRGDAEVGEVFAEESEGEREAFHVCGDDCGCGQGLEIEQGHLI